MALLSAALALAPSAPKPAMAQQAVRSGYQPQPDAEGHVVQASYFVPLAMRSDGAGQPLMRLAVLADAPQSVAPGQFPASLRALPPEQDLEARVTVMLDPQGVVVACQGQEQVIIADWQAGAAVPLPGDLADHTCAIARQDLRFHHALDQAGQPTGAALVVTVRYGWERPMPSPAPSSAASWAITGDWDARHFSAWQMQGLSLSAAITGSAFVPEDRTRPRRADVGVLFAHDAAGNLTDCRVIMPSGVAAFDDGSCPALRSIRVLPVGGRLWARRNLPLLMRWNGRDVQPVIPMDYQGPQLRREVVPSATMVAGIDPAALTEVAALLSVAPDGSLAGCQLSWPSYNDALDRATCTLFRQQARFTRPRGVFGEAAQGRLDMWVNWRQLTLRPRGV